MKSILCSMVALIFVAQTSQAAYLIRAPGVSVEDYESALFSRNGLEPWSKSHHSPTSTQREQLTELVEQAQRAFLSQSLLSATEKFKSVVAMALVADWDRQALDAINFAYLRLAQLSDSPSERDRYLRSALIFRQELVIDAAVFPPPLVAAMHTQRTALERETLSWEPYKTFRGYEHILINGKDVPVHEGLVVRLGPGEYRVTALSDAHMPFTQIIKAQDLVALRLYREPLLTGSCEAPAWQESAPVGSIEIVAFYGRECLKSWQLTQGSGHWVDNATPSPRKLDLALPSQNTSWATEPPPPTTERPWYRNKWVWLGLGALVTSAALVIQATSDPGPPTVEPNSK